MLGHSLSGAGFAFSLAGQVLFCAPDLMWHGTMLAWQTLGRNSADGRQSQREEEALMANCGNHRGSGSLFLDHKAAVFRDVSESSGGWMLSSLVTL